MLAYIQYMDPMGMVTKNDYQWWFFLADNDGD